MHRLLVLGLNHSTAPLAVREKLAFNAEQVRDALAAFKLRFPTSEAVLISTCNRVELYVAVEDRAESRMDEIAQFIASFHNLEPSQFTPHLYRKIDREVVTHLFTVAGSLDSMVLGETQILGQVREAYDTARAAGVTATMLNPLFQRAVAVGKQIMSETALNEGRLSVASVAVDYARRIFDHFDDKVVLSIGAGKMARLMLRHFADLKPKRLLICNRDPAKAAKLAEEFDGEPVPFEALSDHLTIADIVATSTGASEPIITKARFEKLLKPRRYKPIFMIDIALAPRYRAERRRVAACLFVQPRSFAAGRFSSTQSQRKGAVEAAQKIVAEQVDEFASWHRTRTMGPVIDQLYRRYHKVAQDELARTLNKIPNIGEAGKSSLGRTGP